MCNFNINVQWNAKPKYAYCLQKLKLETIFGPSLFHLNQHCYTKQHAYTISYYFSNIASMQKLLLLSIAE